MQEKSLLWDYPQPFVESVQVETQHIDGLQHTNNAVYVVWCEAVAWAHSNALGLSIGDYQRLDRAMAIRHSEYDYAMASVLGDELLVGTWLTQTDKLNMERRFQVQRASDGVTILRAAWQLVCIEISTGKPRRLHPEFIKNYGSAVIQNTL